MKIGVLGGGQLSRMLALAGYPLGIEVIAIDPALNCSASQVTRVLQAPFCFNDSIKTFFTGVNCITYETENVPIDFVKSISAHFPTQPHSEALAISQDRLFEKQFLTQLVIPIAAYKPIDSYSSLEESLALVGYPAILKTRTAGYDGKGQFVISQKNEAAEAWRQLSSHSLILEAFIHYDYELSIIAVRNGMGDIGFYPLNLNQHQDGILRITQAPFEDDTLFAQAKNYATKILSALNYVGVIAIEFFSKNNQLIVNEIAPRVHNSGHWTIEGADTSQFENHLRALLNLPLGSTAARGYSAMINILGFEPKNINPLLTIPGLHLHRYGKEPRIKRKIGHITVCHDNQQQLAQNVQKALALMI